MSEYVPPPCEIEPDKLIVRMDITVPAKLGSISAIVQPILSVTSAMKCAEGREFQVLLSNKTYSEQGRGIYLIHQLMDRVVRTRWYGVPHAKGLIAQRPPNALLQTG